MSVTIYLIDDDQEEAELLEEALSKINSVITFKWYDNVSDAFESLTKNSPPDLIFLDLNMPELSGKELLQMLRQHSATADLPVVIYSTSISKKDIDDTAPFKVKAFLQKPENFILLCDEIAKVIDENVVIR